MQSYAEAGLQLGERSEQVQIETLQVLRQIRDLLKERNGR